MVNLILLGAGIFSGIVGFLHAIGGEMTDLKKIRESSMQKNEVIEIQASWHFFTLYCLLSAIAIIFFAFNEISASTQLVGFFIALSFLLFAVVWLLITFFNGLDQFFKVPQWILTILITGLIVLGLN